MHFFQSGSYIAQDDLEDAQKNVEKKYHSTTYNKYFRVFFTINIKFFRVFSTCITVFHQLYYSIFVTKNTYNIYA